MHLVLAVNRIPSRARAVGGSHGHAHGRLFVPAPRVIGRPLRFQIEINNIHRRDRSLYPPPRRAAIAA